MPKEQTTQICAKKLFYKYTINFCIHTYEINNARMYGKNNFIYINKNFYTYIKNNLVDCYLLVEEDIEHSLSVFFS